MLSQFHPKKIPSESSQKHICTDERKIEFIGASDRCVSGPRMLNNELLTFKVRLYSGPRVARSRSSRGADVVSLGASWLCNLGR
jgi:hypothetical protein